MVDVAMFHANFENINTNNLAFHVTLLCHLMLEVEVWTCSRTSNSQ